MVKLIRLTESDLNRIVKNVVTRVISGGRINEKVDTELLSNVEYMDNASVRGVIQQMIPASNRGMNTSLLDSLLTFSIQGLESQDTVQDKID